MLREQITRALALIHAALEDRTSEHAREANALVDELLPKMRRLSRSAEQELRDLFAQLTRAGALLRRETSKHVN